MGLVVGTRLGPYEIVASIGAGGMGEVYRAHDGRLGRDVALKVLPERLANSPDALARFDREARAVAALSHPNILAIFDTGRDGEVAYVVTELVEGMTLRDAIASGSLPRRKAIDYAVQVARGLAAAHERGIVHRDLKPENIIVGGDGQVKILDFGLARATGAVAVAGGESPTLTATTPGVVLGTLGYLAPEQARGATDIDHRADLFSLGCVLYEMLAGRGPFRRDTPAESLAAVLREDPPPLPATQAPLALQRVIDRCLEKSPAERFQSARDLAFALDSTAVSSSTAGAAIIDAPSPRRRWTVPAWFLLVVVAAVAGLATGMRIGAGTRASAPRFRQLSFDRGTVRSARFAPDGNTVVYGAAWRGEPLRMFVTRTDTASTTPLELPFGDLLAISNSGELAVSIGRTFISWVSDGTLARVPLLGSSPRPLAEHVRDADWIPGTGEMVVVRRVGERDRLEVPMGHPVYDTTGYLSHPRVSHDGSHVAFLDHPLYGDNRGFVAVVDRSTRPRRLTPEYGSVEGLAWSPDGREIWFSGTGVNSSHLIIDAVSIAGGAIRHVYEAPADLQVMDVADNGRALVAASIISGTIQGRGPKEAFERNLTWGGWSAARVLSRDGSWVAETNIDTASTDYLAYLRPMDGSAAVPMGQGEAQDISPDDKWSLAMTPSQPPKLLLVPMGPGESKALDLPGLTPVTARFFPDGAHVFVAGTRADGRQDWMSVSLTDGTRQTIAHPAGMDLRFAAGGRVEVSPDGQWLAYYSQPGADVLGIPVAGGAPHTLLKLQPDERFLNWATDAAHVFVARWEGMRARVLRVTLASGRRDVVHEISVADPAGATMTPMIFISRSGDAYVYSFNRMLGNLYLVDGLQ